MMIDRKQRLFELMHRVGGMPLNERYEELNEKVDWDTEFPDANQVCISAENLLIYLNKILDNQAKKPWKREKMPLYIHNKNIKFNNKNEIDLDQFIFDITRIPPEILSKNSKMEKTDIEGELGFNIGVPAFQGLVYDMELKTFHIVVTCPGAGPCLKTCYGRKGNYVYLPKVSMKQTRVLNLLLNNPKMFEDLLLNEIKHKLIMNPNYILNLRFNDAGDFFTVRFFQIAKDITKTLVESGYKFKSYAYTKMGNIINIGDPYMKLRFSDDAKVGEKEKINVSHVTSKIVPYEKYKNFFLKGKSGHLYVDVNNQVVFTENGESELKNMLSTTYHMPIENILTYDEYLKAPLENEPKYGVIVNPKGGGDRVAWDSNVKIVFLLQH